MKQRVGELNGKQIVICDYDNEVTYEEILLEDKEGLVLKAFNSDGMLVPITKETTHMLNIIPTVDFCDVTINLNSSIVGPNKWIKDNDYIFYINKKEDFAVLTDTGEDITSKACIVATGANNKVYKLPAKYYTNISISEVL